MWILILTLSGLDLGRPGAAIDHVVGFQEKVSCEQAGEKWKKNLSVGADYVCIQASSEQQRND